METEIIFGTYEEFLLGYRIVKKEEKYELQQSFVDHSHQASIRCLSSCAKLMASGSADETIYLYDMMTRKEIGVLMQHSAVTHISIHPSGKLALSLGNDATLRTWNLIKGRQAYAINLGRQRTLSGKTFGAVLWSPDGNMYAIAVGPEVDVYEIASAGVVYAIKLDKKVTSVCFLQETEILIGDESGHISWYSIAQKKLLQQVPAHENRVKCISRMKKTEKFTFVSASSTGEIKVWQQKSDSFRTVCNVNCGCRITCMVVVMKNKAWHADQRKLKKQKTNAYNGTKSAKDPKPEVYRNATMCKNYIRKSNTKYKRTESSVICTNGQNWLVEPVEMKL